VTGPRRRGRPARWPTRSPRQPPSVRSSRFRAGEAGAVSVLVVALVGLVLMLGLAASFVTATASAHRRAQAAADLAALAGAVALGRGEDACGAAAQVAASNGAAVRTCRIEGRDVVVEVGVSGPEHRGFGWDPRGRARAGPGGTPLP
jgi:secretion/DNA translocation related TadE-like protein